MLLIKLLLTRYTAHNTQHTAHNTAHSTQYAAHSTSYTTPATQHQLHNTSYTAPATQYQLHNTSYTIPATQHQLHSARYTLQLQLFYDSESASQGQAPAARTKGRTGESRANTAGESRASTARESRANTARESLANTARESRANATASHVIPRNKPPLSLDAQLNAVSLLKGRFVALSGDGNKQLSNNYRGYTTPFKMEAQPTGG